VLPKDQIKSNQIKRNETQIMLRKNLIKFAKMKKKGLFIFASFILVSVLLFWLANSPQKHLSNIVLKTKFHIKNINSKFQSLDGQEPDEDDDSFDEKEDLEVDSTYLELLGFVKEPNLFREDAKKVSVESSSADKIAGYLSESDDENTSNTNNNNLNVKKYTGRIPPLVTAFSRFSDKEKALIESKLKYFLNDLIIIYDLDLSSSEQLKMKKMCNSSCHLKTFKGDKYPRHLVDAKMKAYKPIIIQDVLNEFGSIIWIEPPNIFISNKVESFLNKSKVNGITAWPLIQPITQMTHPSMFKYFRTKQSDFYFVHMLDTSQFILYNNKDIHTNLMLPWVKCALKEDCISPPGSKYYGCDFSRRPAFLYSSCHRYEMSAFSIITALLFNYDQTKYTTQSRRRGSDNDSDDDDQPNLGAAIARNSHIPVTLSYDAKDASEANSDALTSFIQNYYQSSYIAKQEEEEESKEKTKPQTKN
jgi:hypothetical protein